MLAEPPVPWPELAQLQLRYVDAGSDRERRAIAVEFQDVAGAIAARERADAASLDELLDKLGPRGSADRVVRFFPKFLRHVAGPKRGQRFVLARFQEQWTREFFERDKHGRRVYTVGLFGGPKGTGKTPWGAGLCLEGLCSYDDAPECYSIAGAREQAKLATTFARYQAEDGAPLAPFLRAGTQITRRDGPGFYKPLSVDGRLAQGVIPLRCFSDEGWLLKTDREVETVNAQRQALHKRDGEAAFFAFSTAGWPGGWLHGMYEEAIRHPRLEVLNDGFLRVLRDRESGFLMHWYGLPDGFDGAIDDPKVVRACNPASHVRPAALIKQLNQPGQDERDFIRLNLNGWTSARGAWPLANRWPELASQEELAPGSAVWVSIDAGHSYDTTAVTWCGRSSSGRILTRARVYSVRDAAPHHVLVPDVTIDNEEWAERFVLGELARTYRVQAVGGDPAYLDTVLRHIAKAGYTTVEVTPQSTTMREAIAGFLRDGLTGLLGHDGDPVYRAHVQAVEGIRNEQGWRLQKLAQASPIDAAVSGCISHWLLEHVAESEPFVLL